MTYAILMMLSFLGPFALSFDKKVSFYRKFKIVFYASLFVAVPFLIWDYYFTNWGIWGFNSHYLLGYKLLNLPIEEVSFFFIIPFCCLFIHEVLEVYFKPNPSPQFILSCVVICILISVILINLFHERTYTFWANILFIFLILLGYFKFRESLGRFIFTYIVCIIPFLIVNGILTGFITTEPIVWYNNAENISMRIGSIPIEDLFYNFDLLFANVIIYDRLKSKFLSDC